MNRLKENKMKNKMKKKKLIHNKRAVVYFRNIPHGFYEHQLYKFFSQFGEITRLRLLRNKKTTQSKGKAFIEFLYKDVAQIVAKTMNNYLMFDKIIKTRLIPTSKIMGYTFKRWNDKLISSRIKHKRSINKDRDFMRQKILVLKKIRRINNVENELKKYGIFFNCLILTDKFIKSQNPFSEQVKHISKSKISLRRIMKLPKFLLLKRAIPNLRF